MLYNKRRWRWRWFDLISVRQLLKDHQFGISVSIYTVAYILLSVVMCCHFVE